MSIYDNNNYLTTVSFSSTWSGGAYATWSTSDLTAGSHTLKAVYNPTGGFQSSSTTTSETVNAATVMPTSTSLYVSSNPVTVGQNLSLYTYVYANAGSAAPTGNVSIYDNNNYLTTVSFSSTWSGGAYATWSTSNLTAGSHTLKAVYNPTGGFQSGGTTTSETVNAATVMPTSTSLLRFLEPGDRGPKPFALHLRLRQRRQRGPDWQRVDLRQQQLPHHGQF